MVFGIHGAELSSLNMAFVAFDLPPGASVTSIGGFSIAVLPAPEPSALLFRLSGVLGIALTRLTEALYKPKDKQTLKS